MRKPDRANFAMPVAHQEGDDYSAFEGLLLPFGTYQQELETMGGEGIVSGLRLFLSAQGAVADLFAWLDGWLVWKAGSATEPARLVLAIDTDAGTKGKRLGSLWNPVGEPISAVYENVDRDAVKAALEALVLERYQAAVGLPEAQWHRMIAAKMAVGKTKKTVKQILDALAPPKGPPPPPPPPDTPPPPDPWAAVKKQIAEWVGAFLEGKDPLRRFPVEAGDRIGRAAAYRPEDPRPDPETAPEWMRAPDDEARARRLTFRTLNAYDEALNPAHWLQHFLARQLLPEASRVPWSVTTVVKETALAHPLIGAYPELRGATRPGPWLKIGRSVLVPNGVLGRLHGYKSSKNRWRYTENGGFEWKLPTGAKEPLTASERERYAARAGRLWGPHRAAINRVCDALQLPCEILVSAVGTEVEEIKPRLLRLETLEPGKRDNKGKPYRDSVGNALAIAYDKLTAVHGFITSPVFEGEQTRFTFSILAPDQPRASGFARNPIVIAERRLRVASAKAGASFNHVELTVADEELKGGFADGASQGPKATLFYAALEKKPGGADPGSAPSTAAGRVGTLRRLRVKAKENGFDGAVTVELLKNGTPTGLVVQLKTKTKEGTDAEHAVATAAGDKLTVRVTTPDAKDGKLDGLTWDFLHSYAAGTGAVLDGGMTDGVWQQPNRTLFYPPNPRGSGKAAVADAAAAAGAEGTLRLFAVRASANKVNGNTTVTVFKNGEPTALRLTLAAGKTTAIDTTTTVPVKADDTLAIQVVTGAGVAGQDDLSVLRCSLLVETGAIRGAVVEPFVTEVPAGAWPGGARVRPEAPMTWDQLLEVIDASNGMLASPGITQTLLGTAHETLGRLPDEAFTAAGIARPAGTPGDLLKGGWLLGVDNQLFAGAAIIRRGYFEHETRYDLPLVGAAYNFGHLSPVANPWGLNMQEPLYVYRAGVALNAAVEIFDAADAASAPTIRHTA